MVLKEPKYSEFNFNIIYNINFIFIIFIILILKTFNMNLLCVLKYFEISKVIFISFFTGPYIFLVINRKNVEFQVKKRYYVLNLIVEEIFYDNLSHRALKLQPHINIGHRIILLLPERKK